ncbi:MAG: hypothetical protein WA941_03345 [Nitrososphaeraceae archaeon]
MSNAASITRLSVNFQIRDGTTTYIDMAIAQDNEDDFFPPPPTSPTNPNLQPFNGTTTCYVKSFA